MSYIAILNEIVIYAIAITLMNHQFHINNIIYPVVQNLTKRPPSDVYRKRWNLDAYNSIIDSPSKHLNIVYEQWSPNRLTFVTTFC